MLPVLLAACGGADEAAPAVAAPDVVAPDVVAPGPAIPVVVPPEAPVPGSSAGCSDADQRDRLHAYMREHYFWNQPLRSPLATAPDMNSYFRSMLNLPLDRYSYTQQTQAFEQFYTEGTRTGFGYTLVWTDALRTQLRVRNVEPRSPVAAAGLRRGDLVLGIDGLGPRAIAQGGLPAVTTPGIARRFAVVGADGLQREFTAVSANFPLAPVAHARVIDMPSGQGTVKVAYLAFHEFIIAGESDLDRAFKQFNAAGATELVLDLRYNGGGSVVLARGLASMIGGPRLEGKTFADIRFNSRNAGHDFIIPLTTNIGILPGPVINDLKRLFVITSPSTASASELVINALRPFMPVVLVGATTFGKPYGFQPRTFCGTTYSAVNFETLNALGQGRYESGFAPDCPVRDDLDHELGDASEARLAAALHHVRYGACPQPPAHAMAQLAASAPAAPVGEAALPQMWLD
ncbi:MAG: S41 family peptidase [Ramlibacter sp.]